MSSTGSRILQWGISLPILAAMFSGVSVLPAGTAEGQTVFIPSFRNFTYRGAVRVPDGGTTLLGGVTSSSEQANSSGVPGLGGIPGVGRAFRNRGIGRQQQAGNLSTKVQIIDMKEMEEDHLARAGYLPGQPHGQGENADVARKAAFLSKHVGRRPSAGSRSDR